MLLLLMKRSLAKSTISKAKSTDDQLFQSIMEHVVAAFLDVEKAFENVKHNRLRYKIFQV